ncbi:MAG TPA: YraN family protein [Gaiellaceae bacterium]|jgi:putative endonuclease|nr:YraN family protein [Gaiellaceae bacterium]
MRHASERRAAWHYRLRGYRILGANVWAGGYELDLIARRGRTLVFCEVKSRHDAGFGRALEMVGPEKVRRVRQAAEAWRAAHPELRALRVRFDVVAEQDGRLQRVSQAF